MQNQILCPKCHSLDVRKNGTAANHKQRYQCRLCRRQFITNYSYRGCRPEFRELIVPMGLNGSGIRDTSRVLRISPNTVLKTLRQAADAIPEPPPPKRAKRLELDEFWSFTANKKDQRWTWYAWNPDTRTVVAYVNARRTDVACRALVTQIGSLTRTQVHTDEWKSYAKCVPPQRHRVGKRGTQRIERQNLNFRTHIKRLQRRTICFSKTVRMHDAMIKLYIHHCCSGHHLL